MADNYLENHHNDYLAQKARKERERLQRLRRYRLEYIKRKNAQHDDGASDT